MVYFAAFMVIFCAVTYLLYRRGLAVSKCIRALVFVFRPGKDGDQATLDSCTGWVKHGGRFREGGRYAFSLDDRLTKGEAEFSLLDEKKRTILRLDRRLPEAEIELEGKSGYSLRWAFSGASGKCAVRWHRQ